MASCGVSHALGWRLGMDSGEAAALMGLSLIQGQTRRLEITLSVITVGGEAAQSSGQTCWGGG